MKLRKLKNLWPGPKPALLALAAVVAVGVPLGYAERGGTSSSIAAAGRQQAQIVSSAVIEPRVTARRLRRGLSRASRRRLDRAVKTALPARRARVTIWDHTLATFYSNQRRTKRAGPDPGALRTALTGRTATRTTTVPGAGHLLDVFLPLREQDGQPLAALEVGLPYEQVASQASRSANRFYLTLGAGL